MWIKGLVIYRKKDFEIIFDKYIKHVYYINTPYMVGIGGWMINITQEAIEAVNEKYYLNEEKSIVRIFISGIG